MMIRKIRDSKYNISITYLGVFMLSFVYSLEAQTPEEYVGRYNNIAIEQMKKHGIPASIILAQGILESGSGNSQLAQKSKNHFGIKCHSSWDGERVYHDDDEEGECFRKYDDVRGSYLDHGLFLTKNSRYKGLFDLPATDYESWAEGLKEKGYATSPVYAEKLIGLIEKYSLAQYDIMAGGEFYKVGRLVRFHPNRILYVDMSEGQTLGGISKTHGISKRDLIEYNDLRYDQLLKGGQRIFLQQKRKYGSEEEHVVKDGDNMYAISQIYGIRLADLYERNNMKIGQQPKFGQKLYLRVYQSIN